MVICKSIILAKPGQNPLRATPIRPGLFPAGENKTGNCSAAGAFLPIAGFARLKKILAIFENAKLFQKSLLPLFWLPKRAIQTLHLISHLERNKNFMRSFRDFYALFIRFARGICYFIQEEIRPLGIIVICSCGLANRGLKNSHGIRI
jgi:hypothetical protein